MAAPQLETLQRALAAAFRRLTPIEERAELAAAVTAIVRGNDRLTPLEQAEIYRGQFWLRHRDALYEDYPGLSYLLGEEAFEQLLRDYLSAHPPDSFTLRDLGNHLAAFAATYDRFPEGMATLARDMATFELAFIEVWDGAGAEPIALAKAEAMSPEAWVNAIITFDPLLTLLELSHPVHELRTKLRAGEAPPRELTATPTYVAVWRGDDLRIHYRSHSAAEHELLCRLRRGEPLGSACEHAARRAERPEAIAEELATWFRGWATRGFITDVR